MKKASSDPERNLNIVDKIVTYCRFQVTFHVRCELANYVSKFGNWAFVNKCSYSIIITNSMKYKPSWSTTGPRTFH